MSNGLGDWSRREVLSATGAALLLAAGTGKLAYGGSQVKIFRGIRYAKAERFGQPEPVPFTESLISTERGPISPQRPSRLEIAMGPLPASHQDEHCQVLSVFTPARSGKRPVMVFLHGGAFVTGGGELPWYDGDKLAAEQDVVVVTVTYRLGALGYLLMPGSSGPSPGTSDQILALRWVKAHIASFGGNPENITVFGQSAGGISITALLAWGHGGKLFSRAIVQSGGFPLKARSELEGISKAYLELLPGDISKRPADDLIEAQVELTTARKGDPGWWPIAPESPAKINTTLMAGWTRDDLLPFVLIGQHRTPTPGTDLAAFRKITDAMIGPTRQLAQDAVKAGQKAFLYNFAWNGPDTGLGDCHTIELPFLLGSEDAWKDAPMLKGAAWTDIEAKGRTMRAVWANYARDGVPSVKGMPPWPAGKAAEQPVVDLPPS
jgi:para-nitrobenzyl esterase